MADLIPYEIDELIRKASSFDTSSSAKQQLKTAILDAQARAAEAEDLRRQLKASVRKAVGLEVEVTKLQERLSLVDAAPHLIVPSGQWLVGPRTEMDLDRIGKGWPVIFTDDPRPLSSKEDAQ